MITSKIKPVVALATCATAVVVGLLSATPAQAESNTPLAPAAGNSASSTPTQPNLLCDFILSNGTTIGLCSVGTYFDGGNPYRWPVTKLDTTETANRVWFHQFPDGSGWNHCFSGGGSYSVPVQFQHPGNIQISSNTAPCP